MGEREHRRDDDLASALDRIGCGLSEIAAALKTPRKQPRWAKRMEQQMSDQSEALSRLTTNVDNLATEVGEIQTVLANIPPSDDPAVTTAINEVADRLGTLKDNLEGATTLDDPAAPEDPEEPTDPENPGDQPPVDNPPTV